MDFVPASSSKRLDDHQNHDRDHQNRWYLIENLIEFLASRVPVEGEIALGRFGEPSEIAAVVAFLASDEGHWVTGQTIEASGGYKL